MLRFSANLSLMFTEWALPDRFAAARDAGFAGVEIQFPYDHPVDLLAKARERAGVEVVLINTPVGLPDHPVGFAVDPAQGVAFAASLDRAAEVASALGALRINILVGRGEAGPLLIDRLATAQRQLAAVPARVLIEALNPTDVPGYALASIDAAHAVAAACPEPIGLQFDIYHLAAIGGDCVPAIDRLLPWIAHVQFADWPGRHEPGTGTVPILAALDRLDAGGYDGWIGAEYRPSGATIDSLGWLRPWQDRYRA